MSCSRILCVLSMVALLGALPAAAVYSCDSCNSNDSCDRPCSGGPPGVTTCGGMGSCSGGGGGPICLTVADTDALRAILDAAAVRPEGQLRGQIAARLTWRLAQFVEEAGLGTVYGAEAGFQLSKVGQVRTATLAFMSRERRELGKKIGAPDLVAEVASMDSEVTVTRVREWLTGGARVVLVLDPGTKTLTVHRSSGTETLAPENILDLPDVVPGWSLRVGDLFE